MMNKTNMLASVMSLEEAALALSSQVHIIDLKNPKAGALGALDLPLIADIVKLVNGQKLISATIGDLPLNPAQIKQAVIETDATGVDIVKIGFSSGDIQPLLNSLQPLIDEGVQLVAVLFAESKWSNAQLAAFASAGFYGVMLDTALKNGKHLLDYRTVSELKSFVDYAQSLDLKVGLAGSLRLEHIALLSAVRPDYLGFRGALTAHHQRTESLLLDRIEQAISLLRKCNSKSAAGIH